MARIKWLWRDKLTDVQRTELFTWIKDLATPTPSLPKPVAALSDEQQPAFPAAVEPFSTRPVRDLSHALSGPFGGPPYPGPDEVVTVPAVPASVETFEKMDRKIENVRQDMLCQFAAMRKDVNERLDKSAQDTHREIVSVTNSFDELRRIKEVLQKMQNEKLFGFITKLSPNDFRALCAILAKGDMAKAARALHLAETTVTNRVRLWRSRGPAYKVLLEMVRWRKKIGQKGTVPVPESVLQNTASHTDFAGILADVLEEILAMTEENWQEKAEALAELLRPLVQG
jgi:hypothetical protein